MIRSKKELKFYIMADMMMNRGKFRWTLRDRIKHLIMPDSLMRYLKSMRILDYYSNSQTITPPPNIHKKIQLFDRFASLFHLLRFRRLSVKLGYSIGFQTLGYGVVLHHHGTIVVGMSNRLGNYTVLHTSTCIADMNIKIGNALYLGTGAKIISHVSIGDNVSIGANSVVTDSFESNCLAVGIPAKKIRDDHSWYEKSDEVFRWRINQIEKLKNEFEL